MNSKKANLLISNLLIIITIAIFILVLHHTLSPIITSVLALDVMLVSVAVLLYLFLGSPLIDHFLSSDKEIKAMIDETLHELNTPIATIDANISMLSRNITDEKSQKRLNRIKQASLNLKTLYDGIEYNLKSNIEAVEKTTFDLRETIDHSIKKFEEQKRDIRLLNEIPSFVLNTDKSGFERVIDNLLSNAIKYNQQNGFVRFYLVDNILHIEDSGIGIDTKNLFIVFEKSYQENPSTQGYGLGLSIVKSFCDKHKVKIKIDTKKHKGTTMMLDLTALII